MSSGLVDALATVRERQLLSELSRRLGIHPSVPRLWANGARSVPARRVEAVAAVLAEWGIAAGTDGAAPAPTVCARCGAPLAPSTRNPRRTCSRAGRAAVSRGRVGAPAEPPRPPQRRHGREYCRGAGCRWCRGAASLRAAYASGRRVPATTRALPWFAWTREEEALLRELRGTVPLAEITARINALAPRPRTAVGVGIRAASLGLSVQWQRSMGETARLLGVGYPAVRAWLERGWLHARPWARMGPHMLLNVADADLDAFIRGYPWLLDPARMRPSRWRSLVEVERRRQPCLSLREAGRALGYRDGAQLYVWQRRGLVPTVPYIGPWPRSVATVYHLVRARDLPAIGEAIAAASGATQQANAARARRIRWDRIAARTTAETVAA